MPISTDPDTRSMQPEALRMVQRVFRRIIAEGRVSGSLERQQQFAAYLLRMYFRGMTMEDNLYSLGVAAAKARYGLVGGKDAADVHFTACKVLIVEDDYFLAADIRKVFEEAGATVATVGREADAMTLLDAEVPNVAVIDLDLGGGVSFRIAQNLRHRSVPMCIYSGYKRDSFRPLPEGMENVVWVEKPAEPGTLLRIAAEIVA